MASVQFTVVQNGYSPAEVDRYVGMLQQEYNQAIAWGEELEEKLNELKASMEAYGVYFTMDPTNQSEVIQKVFDELSKTVARIKDDAAKEAQDIVDAANERAKSIVHGAMSKSVELREQNEAVMKNLKSISDMIRIIIEKTGSE